MNRKSRFLKGALTAAVAFSVTTIAACTPSSNMKADDSGQSDAQTLTIWHYYSVDDQLKTLESYKASFEADHPGITVDNVYVPQDQINSKVITAAGSGSGPDIVVFDGYSATTLIAANAVQSIDSYWEGFDSADQFPDGTVTKVDGKRYTVQGYTNTLALFYNKTILDEVGVNAPTTLEELESSLAKVTEAGYEGIVLAGQADVQGAFQAYPWETAVGFNYENPDSAALAKAFERVRGWIDKGWLSEEAATWDQNVPFTRFTAGGIAFAENGNWQLTGLTQDASFDWGVVKLPVGDGRVYLGGEAEGIGVNSKNPDLAWQYLTETFLSKEGQLGALKHVGAIPTRLDAASDEAIASDPNLSVFASVIADQGAPFPDPVIPANNNEKTILAAGQAWSAALSGQTAPMDAATHFLGQLDSLLKAE